MNRCTFEHPVSKAIFVFLVFMCIVGVGDLFKQKVRSECRVEHLEVELRRVKEELSISRDTVKELSASVRSVSETLGSLHENGPTPARSTHHVSLVSPVELIAPATPVQIPVNGFQDGQRLQMVIVTTHNSSARFQVNFMKNCQYFLHFNPRYHQQAVVRNSAVSCNSEYAHFDYSREERQHEFSGFPFKKDHVYTLEFIARKGTIEIFVNGKLLCTYEERYPGREIDMIKIEEDVEVHYVRLDTV